MTRVKMYCGVVGLFGSSLSSSKRQRRPHSIKPLANVPVVVVALAATVLQLLLQMIIGTVRCQTSNKPYKDAMRMKTTTETETWVPCPCNNAGQCQNLSKHAY
jgi:hypothetical protein